jgi:hypothetical protein
MTLTPLFIIGAAAILGVGLRILKFEKGNKQGESEIYGRDILAFSMIVLGIMGGFVSLQTFQAEAAGGGGGPSLLPCPDVPNLPCYVNMNSFLNQTGTATCIAATNNCITSTITFGHPYTHTPLISSFETLNPLAPQHALAIGGATVSNLITVQTPGNSTLLVFNSQTAVTVTVPNADTAIKSWSPSSQTAWAFTLIEAEGYVTTTATSTKQVITLTLEDCVTATIFQTIKIETPTVTAAIIPFAIKGTGAPSGFGVCDSVNVTAPAVDANTSVTVVALRVYGPENGFRTWLNMPAATTEIYGSTNLEQKFNFQAATGILITFCVNVFASSNGGAPYLTVYVNGAELTTNLRLPIGSGFTGLQCTAANTNLSTGIFPVTIFGNGGAGLNDFPAFGAISINWNQANAGSNLGVPVGYSQPIVLALTPQSFQLKIQFDATITTPNTVTFTWYAFGI